MIPPFHEPRMRHKIAVCFSHQGPLAGVQHSSGQLSPLICRMDDIDWNSIDKTKFFVQGLGLFSVSGA